MSTSIKTKIALGLVCTLPLFAHATDTNTQVGRYLTIENKPTTAQRNLLSQTIQVRFPQNIKTIGEAINYLLQFSGYSLIEPHLMNDALKIIISKPLPVIDHELGPTSLHEGLITLVGPAFQLFNDPINRQINFRLRPAFAKNFKTKHIEKFNEV